mmetsp:Transcript_2425/g.7475  ORF Transcript_2425/g.7475 Transcript_2425/m.7475 type:complete len:236 (-) Transcript_2425:1980-2687(-)
MGLHLPVVSRHVPLLYHLRHGLRLEVEHPRMADHEQGTVPQQLRQVHVGRIQHLDDLRSQQPVPACPDTSERISDKGSTRSFPGVVALPSVKNLFYHHGQVVCFKEVLHRLHGGYAIKHPDRVDLPEYITEELRVSSLVGSNEPRDSFPGELSLVLSCQIAFNQRLLLLLIQRLQGEGSTSPLSQACQGRPRSCRQQHADPLRKILGHKPDGIFVHGEVLTSVHSIEEQEKFQTS